MSATTQPDDGRRTDAELTDTELSAYTPTGTGAEIRLRGGKRNGEWIEQVVVTDDAGTVVLYEGRGIKPCAVYNQAVEAFTDETGEVSADV